jgi:AcrR family transcriptional regulator
MARRLPRTRLSAPARRAQLLDVGRTVFAERGFELASMDEIATRAGITKPIVYEHFGSKEGLYAAVVEREMDELVGSVSEALSQGSSRERWEAAVVVFLDYVEHEPAGFEVLTREAPLGVGRRGLTRVVDQLAERVAGAFNDGFRQAGYATPLAPFYANALLGMVTQVGVWWAEGGRVQSRDHVVRHLAALGWMGLRHLPKKPARVKPPRPRATR